MVWTTRFFLTSFFDITIQNFYFFFKSEMNRLAVYESGENRKQNPPQK